MSAEARVNQYVAKATRARVVLNHTITIGELLMWENTESVCFLYEDELGQRMMQSFADTRVFVRWLEKAIKAGHNIHSG